MWRESYLPEILAMWLRCGCIIALALLAGCFQLRDRPFIGSIVTTQMCPPGYTCVPVPMPEPTQTLRWAVPEPAIE